MNWFIILTVDMRLHLLYQAGRLEMVSEAQDVEDIDTDSASMNTQRINENNTDDNDASEAIIIRRITQGHSMGLSGLQAKYNSSDTHLVSVVMAWLGRLILSVRRMLMSDWTSKNFNIAKWAAAWTPRKEIP